jgi:predicted kinase
MNTLIILRGLPGAGKSTLAKYLTEKFIGSSVFYEADQYFVKDGVYQWDPNQIGNAHKHCQNMIQKSMELNIANVVVSNTFTKESELQVYYDLANKYNYRVFSLIIENRHSGMNIHNVPKDTLDKMYKNLSNNIKLK